jgi:hypothetical protein
MNEIIKAGADINAGDGGYSLGTEEKYNEFAKRRNQSMGKMRIRELAEQAGYSKDYLEIGLPSNMEKFAELIVQECATVIEQNLFQGIGWNTSRAVKRHFGIEDEE